jgi:hypothetical protein
MGLGPVGVGDGGGVGGSAGEVTGDGLNSVEAVNELSDERLDKYVRLDGDMEIIDGVGTMVFALVRFRNRPMLSRSIEL